MEPRRGGLIIFPAIPFHDCSPSTDIAMPRSAVSERPRNSGQNTLASGADGQPPADDPRQFWLNTFLKVRTETERRAALLSAEDQMVQSMAEASPTKWHRAHVTWFFEEFLLRRFAPGYKPYDPRFGYLFNSYYVAAGPRHARPQRGLLTRPGAAEVTAYRAHVDAAVAALIDSSNDLASIVPIVELGINHEQQHQELLLTDILHAFSFNAMHPAYDPQWRWPDCAGAATAAAPVGGIRRIGYDGAGFCFDNERPAHQIMLRPVRLSPALVTNGEWLEFMADGGYATPMLWLSDGFATAEAQGWSAPGYWTKIDGVWFSMTLGGLRPVEPSQPVCHVSYYEADAFARWASKHLPNEGEWEVAAESGALGDGFGIVWQWTRSAYAPYPGYRADAGALGEYNGKFMVNQMVLRGSSLATPANHSRPTYRNFFYPGARWQFSGLRLAEYEG
jgi:ergothioneine biosynthesis protein EgtB